MNNEPRRSRDKAGHTQVQAAMMLGVSLRTWEDWERGINQMPGYALKLYRHRVVGDMKHSNAVMDGAFSFGNHQDVDSGARQYVAEQVRAFLRSRSLT